jgi:hypothetical protein
MFKLRHWLGGQLRAGVNVVLAPVSRECVRAMDEYLSAWMKAEHPGFKFNSPDQARLGRYNPATF